MNISIKQGLDFNKYQEKIIKQTIQKSKRKRKGNNCPNKLCQCINCTCGVNCSCGKEDNKGKKEGFDNINDVVQEYDNTLSQYKFSNSSPKPYRRIIALHCCRAVEKARNLNWIKSDLEVDGFKNRALELARLSLGSESVTLKAFYNK